MTRGTLFVAAMLAAPFVHGQGALHAQDAAAKAAPKQADQRLQKSLATMAQLPSCAFSTVLSWQQGDGKKPRGAQVVLLGGGGRLLRAGAEERVKGVSRGGVLGATCSGDNEVVFAGRRQIARVENGDWKLRDQCLAGGQDLPFVLDPQLLFDRLLALGPEVTHAEVGTWNDRPIEILTVTVEGDDAVELLWSGALPEQGGGLGGIMIVNQGGRKAVPKPDVVIDLAFFVDPATRLVHELKVRSYAEAGAKGARIVAIGGPGGGFHIGGEEEEEEEEQEATAPAFEDGLPVRDTEDRVVQKLDVTFTDHGEAPLPELDETARRLLGLK